MVSPVFNRPLLLAILVTTAIIGIVTAISRNGSHGAPPVRSAFQQLPRNIDIALHKARFSELHNGSVVWELDADRVEYDKSGDLAHLSGISMNVLRPRNAGRISLRADSGDFQAASKNVLLRGNVHVFSGDDVSFDTSALDYDAARSQFSTTAPVTFKQRRLTLKAVGMELSVDDQRARFKSPLEATIAGVTALK
ncbi:MAG TPA: LPS export ABC transporter periplasmic protein LptC [Desulfuromonadales bacterium]|nr:LPS export ABC transporter periplasmic protein LptC [Desulfuromonadales bacterium]